jgi:hypothetical protein
VLANNIFSEEIQMNHSRRNHKKIESNLILRLSMLLIMIFSALGAAQAQWSSSSGNTTTTDKVGIGAASPGDKLSIEGSVSGGIVGGYVKNTAGTASSTVSRFSVGQTNSETVGLLIQFDHNADNAVLLNRKSSTGTLDLNTTGGGIRIDNSGKVGIGTTSPGEMLSVNGGSLGAYYNSGYGIRGIFNHSGNSSGILSAGGLQIASQGTDNAGNGSGDINFFVTSSNSAGAFTDGTYTQAVKIKYNGNVGIGTTSPGAKLDVNGSIYSAGQIRANTLSLLMWGTDAAGTNRVLSGAPNIESQDSQGLELGTSTSAPVVLYTGASERLRIDAGGNVGIGKYNPTVALDVVGSINLTGTINAKYQDVAEWVSASEQLGAGTVVVLDSTKSNQVTSSTVSYDTRVAGVISEQPGIALGEKSDGKVLVATTGRVRVKVDATKCPIHIGDLLVTSDVPGVAMKSEPVELAGRKMHMPGTLIGKALEPLEKGKSAILVLLSLQ